MDGLVLPNIFMLNWSVIVFMCVNVPELEYRTDAIEDIMSRVIKSSW